MSVKFTAASSTKLRGPTITIPVYPWTVGMWVKPALLGTIRTFWCFTSVAAADEFIRIGQSATNTWNVVSAQPAITDSWGTVDQDEWSHVIIRFISATNRRMSVLKLNGEFEQANTVGSMTIDVGTAPVISLGATDHSAPTNFFDGDIAEYWLAYGAAHGDIGIASTVAIDRALHTKIAFGGPLSHPPIAYGLREYWSFRAGFSQIQPPDVKVIPRALLSVMPTRWTPSATPPNIGPSSPSRIEDPLRLE